MSLRGVAAAIGTSHRMLIHHFGSKDGLLVAVVQAVEERQREQLAALGNVSGTTSEVMAAFWAHLADPALWPYERLFFELYGQALQGRPGVVGLLDGVVDDWLEPMVQLGLADGLEPDVAHSVARLSLAVARGLLLDLLATGDRPAADAAIAHLITMHEGFVRASSPSPGPPPAA